jgi:hypothetical protein
VQTRRGIPLDDFNDTRIGAPPLSAQGYEAWLRAKDANDAGRGLAAADCLADDFGTTATREYVVAGPWQISEHARAIEIAPTDAGRISAAALLRGEAEIPDGALVVVGYDFADSGDNHVLIPGQAPVAGAWSHVWTLDFLVDEGAACLAATGVAN